MDKFTAKLIRVEFLGGPLDGKWITIADWQETFLVVNPTPGCGRMHRYDRDEIYEPTVRTVFRHAEIRQVTQ